MRESEYEAKDFIGAAEWIEWIDASGRGGGWQHTSDVRLQKVSHIHTIGFVLREDEGCVVIGQSLDMSHDHADHVMTIPKTAILKRWTIR